jgi:hypothetical protein
MRDASSYRIEFDDKGERLVLPLRRDLRALAWGVLAIALFVAVGTDQFQQRRGWLDAIPLAFAAFAIVESIGGFVLTLLGKETIQIVGGRLKHSWRVIGVGREATYALVDMESITAASTRFSDYDPESNNPVSPLREFGRRGRIKIDLADRSLHLGVALKDDDVDQVIAWLVRRLPKSVTFW